MKTDAFAGFHPAVNLCFFAATIGMTMFLMHPAFLAISMVCAIVYLIRLQGGRGVQRGLGGNPNPPSPSGPSAARSCLKK